MAWNDPRAYASSNSLAEIIQEILQRHASGIIFREYNAGPNLDMQMKEEGFDIEIRVDWETGFVMGGNRYNCGTWMDKMGESVKAGTKGIPGTPRDGAPVEITGLVKSTVRWLSELSTAGKFPFTGVRAQSMCYLTFASFFVADGVPSQQVNGQAKVITYGEWADLIEASFEKCYYVPLGGSCVQSKISATNSAARPFGRWETSN